MGKSLRSKRMRANRIRKRIVNRPKELTKLKEALAFEYNDQTENAHISIFHDIVNGPLPTDGTYFEPSVLVLEKTQQRYENYLSRKLPKIAEIASKNLVRPIEDPKEEDGESDKTQDSSKRLKPVDDTETEDIGCKPNKSGSWPKWMSQRKIREAASKRRKYIKRMTNKERRINKNKKVDQKINIFKKASKKKGSWKKDSRKKDSQKEGKSSNSNVDVEMKDS